MELDNQALVFLVAQECGPALNACRDRWPKKIVGACDDELHFVLIPAILAQGILERGAELRLEVGQPGLSAHAA